MKYNNRWLLERYALTTGRNMDLLLEQVAKIEKRIRIVECIGFGIVVLSAFLDAILFFNQYISGNAALYTLIFPTTVGSVSFILWIVLGVKKQIIEEPFTKYLEIERTLEKFVGRSEFSAGVLMEALSAHATRIVSSELLLEVLLPIDTLARNVEMENLRLLKNALNEGITALMDSLGFPVDRPQLFCSATRALRKQYRIRLCS